MPQDASPLLPADARLLRSTSSRFLCNCMYGTLDRRAAGTTACMQSAQQDPRPCALCRRARCMWDSRVFAGLNPKPSCTCRPGDQMAAGAHGLQWRRRDNAAAGRPPARRLAGRQAPARHLLPHGADVHSFRINKHLTTRLKTNSDGKAPARPVLPHGAVLLLSLCRRL